MRESQRDRRLRSFAARFGQDSGRSAPCVQPKTPDGHQRENVRSARDVSPRSVQFSVAKSVQFSVAIDMRSFDTIEALRLALLKFKRTYNEQWMLEKYHYRSPAQVRRDLVGLDAAA